MKDKEKFISEILKYAFEVELGDGELNHAILLDDIVNIAESYLSACLTCSVKLQQESIVN